MALQSTPTEPATLHDRPLVSVIVPSFNQGRFIEETITSALAQDYRPLEVLVLDGGSTDGTLSVLEGYSGASELKVWSEPDDGVVDAVNKGLQKACGEILAIQSSDDVYVPGAIAAAVDALHAHPEAGMVFGDVEHIDDLSRVTGRDVLTAFSLAEYLGRLTYIPQPSAFFRAAVSRSVGGWRAEVSYAADADFWIRIALRVSSRQDRSDLGPLPLSSWSARQAFRPHSPRLGADDPGLAAGRVDVADAGAFREDGCAPGTLPLHPGGKLAGSNAASLRRRVCKSGCDRPPCLSAA